MLWRAECASFSSWPRLNNPWLRLLRCSRKKRSRTRALEYARGNCSRNLTRIVLPLKLPARSIVVGNRFEEERSLARRASSALSEAREKQQHRRETLPVLAFFFFFFFFFSLLKIDFFIFRLFFFFFFYFNFKSFFCFSFFLLIHEYQSSESGSDPLLFRVGVARALLVNEEHRDLNYLTAREFDWSLDRAIDIYDKCGEFNITVRLNR